MVEPVDAVVFVTPEYNYSMPASLKNAIDLPHQEWAYKVAGFVSYGGLSGGIRSVQMVKLALTTLGVLTIVPTVPIPWAGIMLNDGTFTPTDIVAESALTMLAELHKVAVATASLREGQ